MRNWAALDFMRYQLRIDREGAQGILPAHTVKLATLPEGSEPKPIGLLIMTRADARQYNLDANLGAYVREVLAAHDAERKGAK